MTIYNPTSPTDLSTYIPYIGATTNVNLNTKTLSSGAITSTGLLGVTVASGYAGTFMGGNVGIGTTSPRTKLDITTSAVDAVSTVGTFIVQGVDSYGQSFTLQAPVANYTGKILASYKGYGALGSAMLSGVVFANNSVDYFGVFDSSVNPVMVIKNSGKVGIGLTSPTASLNIKAGSASAGTAPIKLTSGTLMTVPELGTIEYFDDGTNSHIYGTIKVAGVTTRLQII